MYAANQISLCFLLKKFYTDTDGLGGREPRSDPSDSARGVDKNKRVTEPPSHKAHIVISNIAKSLSKPHGKKPWQRSSLYWDLHRWLPHLGMVQAE